MSFESVIHLLYKFPEFEAERANCLPLSHMEKKDSAAHSTPSFLNTSISWGLSTESNVGGSAVTQSLMSLKVDARPERLLNTNNFSFQDQDSSSTLSTAQSSTHVATSGDDDPSRHISFSAHSGLF